MNLKRLMKKFSNKLNIRSVKKCFNTSNIVFLILSILIVLLFLYPIMMIFKNGFIVDGKFTLEGYIREFTNKNTWIALLNTIKMAFGVLFITWFLGGSLAFLVERTDYKYKKIINLFVFLSFCIPSYIISVSWIQIVSRGGYIHRILKLIYPSINYSFNTYSLLATTLVLSIHLYPLVFFGIRNALKKSSISLNDAGRLLGGSKWHVFLKITLPLILPSFVSVGLLVFSRTMANFGVAAQLALPAGISVLTTGIYKAMSELDITTQSVLSVILILTSMSIYWVMNSYLNKRNFFFEDERKEKKHNKNIFSLGKSKVFVNVVVSIYFILTFILPLISLTISSFTKRWGLKLKLENLTLRNFEILFFENEFFKRALFNSIIFGIVSSIIAVSLAVVIVYFYKTNKNRKASFIYKVASLPLAVPNIILAVGAIFAWINLPIKIYGTKWIIIFTYIMLFVPIIIKQVKGLADNIDDSIDISAKTLGIPILGRIIKLFFPMIKKGVFSGIAICFLIALREIPISLLLYAKGNETLGVMLFTIQSNAYGLEMTSAVSIIVIIISIVVNIVVKKIGVRRAGL